MGLANGLPWSIPIRSVEFAIVSSGEGSWIRPDDPTGRFVGVLHLNSKYHYDKTFEAITFTVLMTPNTQASS